MALIDRIEYPWGTRTPYRAGEPWPVRVDACLADDLSPDDVEHWVPSASVLHSNGDAMDIAVRHGRIVGVRGRAGDRVNHGRLGPKDLFGWQANNSGERLTEPLIRRGGVLEPTDWDTAMEAVVARTRAVLGEVGPDGIGFYTSGQLFLEAYYTLGVLARAGIGTNHIDGNTRLCTATAAEALKQSFGCDGQPASYTDFDHADVIALFGHNMAETQPVLWERILDRLAGADRPHIVCVDPRLTEVARQATVHLAPLPGTNLALMNALLHEIVANDWVDHAYVAAHTVGWTDLVACVRSQPVEQAAEICSVPVEDLREAARVLGRSRRLLSTVLQGFYQSHQATAAAVAVNNLHLIRGMLGKPGAGVLQMNGQPTAQNTRECGADGDLAGFRNWANPAHVEQLARLWRVEVGKLEHDGPPTHAMEQVRLLEQGRMRMWWVSGTNPAVSLPDLARVRRILGRRECFLVVQDIFRTETTEFADVVLPAATWGEKEGTFTNVDRTVHWSGKAVEPPGSCRSDLDIFLDYARRLDLRGNDGQPLISWHDPRSAFAAWQECSRGRPCDYTGLSYELLVERGVQWPCPQGRTEGVERLYTDGRFPTESDRCESYGKDLLTGKPVDPDAYRATDPGGRAILRAAPWTPPPERPDEQYPYVLTTGRTLYHFHTRTKTARVPQLQAAAPEPWVEMAETDAASEDLREGDLIEISSVRGKVRAPLRISGIRPGVIFLPFHYGYFDSDQEGHHRAANELTLDQLDPCSEQPMFKTAAAAVRLPARGQGSPAPAPDTTASRPVRVPSRPTSGGRDALTTEYLPTVEAR